MVPFLRFSFSSGQLRRPRPRHALGQGGLGQVRASDKQPRERRLHQRRLARVVCYV